MRILVTGGAGYVGSALVPMLLEAGHHVHVVDNLMYGADSLLPVVRYDTFEFTAADVRNRSVMAPAVAAADAIIHLAAIVGMPACDGNPSLAYEVNVGATKLLTDLRSPSQPFFYSSTGSVYGRVEGVCTEESPVGPLSVYGSTKWEGEQIARSKPGTVAYRFATAFGSAPRFRLDLLPNQFVYQALREKYMVVYERHARRTLIHVRDIARSWLHAIDHYDDLREGVFNVGDESMNVTKQEIVEAIAAHVPFRVDYAEFAADPDQRDYEVSYERIRGTGYKTSIGLEEGIRELIRACGIVVVRNPYSNVMNHALGPDGPEF